MTHLTPMPGTAGAQPALRVAGLGKRYAGVTALDDVSFSVGRGEIVGLLGPNGDGKSTTINVILGVLELCAVAYLYARVYRRAVRTGLLARYSAEGTP